jgi:hypothetical protein
MLLAYFRTKPNKSNGLKIHQFSTPVRFAEPTPVKYAELHFYLPALRNITSFMRQLTRFVNGEAAQILQ